MLEVIENGAKYVKDRVDVHDRDSESAPHR